MSGAKVRPTLRSVIGRGHLILALVAVTLASVSLTLLGVLALRVYAEHNLHLIARSINYTVEAAVVFNDSAAATEALSLIASTEEVAQAEVFDANGKLLAQWIRPDTGLLSRVELELAHTLLEQPISQPILHQGRTIGSIHLIGHGGSLLRFLLSGLAGIFICTALSAWIALHLARRLLRGITGPLQSLAAVAHAARSERDFDRRVPPAKIAELDSLGSDFNALLGEMEAWQSHLQSENESLAHQANHDSLTGLPNR
ncbi:CHASE sensor domain-containing protein, partial [Pseudomonas marginalis]